MNHEQDISKERIAAELDHGRRRSNGLTLDVLDEEELLAQHSPLMSPLVWDLAHIGNYEEQWLLRAAAGREALRPDIDHLYDAFENPRAERISLPLLRPQEARDYNDRVRREVLDALDTVDLTVPAQRGPDEPPSLLAAGRVYHLVIQHEHQHDETMLATHQLRRGAPVLLEELADVTALRPPADPEVLVPAGPFTMGAADDPWAYDNERSAHTVDLPAYLIDTAPVTNAAYRAFMDDGGYRTRRWWSREGWEWKEKRGAFAPAFWEREGQGWSRRRFGRREVVPPDEPVQHVNFHEAQAYAKWAGKRLPTEAEWEKAARFDPVTGRSHRYPWGDDEPTARHANLGQRRLGPSPAGHHPDGASPLGVQQLIGDVWEWTSTTFDGYPGFRAFPYRDYSEVFFGSGYKVLRGGSWATHPTAVRSTFRNWDLPIRRQIFSGFRCARHPEPA
ncbi:ergothioneine biosynthesis protein EgtB [Nocardiopsis sp. N85]|uniref:ergothioneine biosynthesis protein EgtB n=1 Tax=Nocardiopsis sp. N85 TaxID=3029400 RepID=UPI00237F9B33|nr:ergothioneine biosynthesis protein EgtB [Nocardiopsis sp. N85]MDE3720008.1 ergothioneine biosynthesis protein EgtB [Nocardiopsis sp. N85]